MSMVDGPPALNFQRTGAATSYASYCESWKRHLVAWPSGFNVIVAGGACYFGRCDVVIGVAALVALINAIAARFLFQSETSPMTSRDVTKLRLISTENNKNIGVAGTVAIEIDKTVHSDLTTLSNENEHTASRVELDRQFTIRAGRVNDDEKEDGAKLAQVLTSAQSSEETTENLAKKTERDAAAATLVLKRIKEAGSTVTGGNS